MAFWYNEARNDEKFSSLVRTEWKECNTSITFSELGIKEDDTFYFLYLKAISINDTIKVGAGKDWKFPADELTTFKIAKKTYQKQDFKTKQQVTIEQHRVEKLFCSLFPKYDLTKVYSGSMFLQDGNIVDMLLHAKDANDKPIPVETIEMMSQPYLSLEIVEDPQFIKLAEINLPVTSGKSGWGGGGGGQNEAGKLGDRLNFVVMQMKVALPEEKIESIADIYKACGNADNSIASVAAAVWDYCTILIK
jgi:hypothetical protein